MSDRFRDDIIWSLARGQLTTTARESIASALAAQIDAGASPSDIVGHLAGHGLIPLAYRHLVAAGDAVVAPALSAELSSEFRRHALTRFRYTRRLRELLTVLEKAGVHAVPYKGPALAIQLFGGYAMRQFGDLDILVPPSQAGQARDALLQSGLTRRRVATKGWDEYLLRARHSSGLRDAEESVVIELHWSLADRYLGMDVGVEWLLEDCETIDLLGRPTRVMRGERLLLAQCLHGAKHLWERAVWLGEVAEIVRRPEYVNWADAISYADRTGLGRALRACLILARDLLDASPPDPWARALHADIGAIRLAEKLSERFGAPTRGRLQSLFRLGYLAQTTLARRALFCWRVATDLSERDMRTAGPPGGWSVVHGLKRSMRLARALRKEGIS